MFLILNNKPRYDKMLIAIMGHSAHNTAAIYLAGVKNCTDLNSLSSKTANICTIFD
jgi:hypothetical protein